MKVSRRLLVCLLVPVLPAWTHAEEGETPSASELHEKYLELEKKFKDQEERLKKVEEDQEAGNIVTRLGESITLGGELEIEYVDTQNYNHPLAGATDEPNPHLQIDHLRLIPRVRFTREIYGQAQLNFNSRRSRLKEAFVTFDRLDIGPVRSRAKLGLDDRFMKPNRRTENYPLVGTAFWRDETIGLFWRSRVGKRSEASGRFSLHLSVANGYSLNFREIGEDEGVTTPSNILHEDRNESDFGGSPEWGIGLEYEKNVEGVGDLELITFAYFDEVSDTDVAFLQSFNTFSLVGGPAYTSNARHRQLLGAQARFRRDGFRVLGHVTEGIDGKVNRWGWYVESSYEFEFKEPLLFDKYLHRVQPFVRYGRLDIQVDGVPANPALPLTWDRDRWTFAVISRITRRNVRLKVEYTLNGETTRGIGSVDNNELIVQLELRF